MSISYVYLADTSSGIRVAATSKDVPVSNPFSVMYDAFIQSGDAASRTKQAGWYELRMEGGIAHVPAHASAPVRAYARAMSGGVQARTCTSARVVMRAMGKVARSTPIGLPGGPCHVIRNIEEENLAPRLRDELIEDIEKGKDLTNAQADKIYGRETFNLGLEVFSKLELTAHGQYRMDLRGVTVPEVKLALDEFVKWYMARKTDQKIKPQDQNLLIDLVQGDPVRFDAKKLGLTIVFMADPKRGIIRLVSTWWTNTPNPAKPKPGECSIIPFLDARNRGESRPAILGSLHKEIMKTARLIVAALEVRKVSMNLPASLKSIDWMADPQKWLEEAKKNILKESGVKGKSGSVKAGYVAREYEGRIVHFGNDLPSLNVKVYNTDFSVAPAMEMADLREQSYFYAATPQEAYQTMVHLTKVIPLMVYAKEVLALFEKTTGAVTKPYALPKGNTVAVVMTMALGGNKVGKLTSALKPDTTPEWTLEWKGQEQTSKDLDVLLDMIDEEGDTMQPIFNNKTKLKKLVDDISKRIGVPVKRVDGTDLQFAGAIQNIRGNALMRLNIRHSLSFEKWYFIPESFEVFVRAETLENPASGPLASLIGKATSVDEAKLMIMDGFSKMVPNLQPRRVNVGKVLGDYAIHCEGGSTFESVSLDDVIDHIREITAFAGRIAG